MASHDRSNLLGYRDQCMRQQILTQGPADKPLTAIGNSCMLTWYECTSLANNRASNFRLPTTRTQQTTQLCATYRGRQCLLTCTRVASSKALWMSSMLWQILEQTVWSNKSSLGTNLTIRPNMVPRPTRQPSSGGGATAAFSSSWRSSRGLVITLCAASSI